MMEKSFHYLQEKGSGVVGGKMKIQQTHVNVQDHGTTSYQMVHPSFYPSLNACVEKQQILKQMPCMMTYLKG